MKRNKWFIYTLLVGLFLSLSFVNSQQSHPANEITSGTFSTGNYWFPGRVYWNYDNGVNAAFLDADAGPGGDAYIIFTDMNGDFVIYTQNSLNQNLGRISISSGDDTGLVDIMNSDFTVDTNTLKVDTVNNRVGIGIDPTQKLHVAGTVQMTGFKMPTGASSSYVLTSDAGGVGTWQPAVGGGYWTLTGSKLYPNDNAWNVGIGTNDPGAKLDVEGEARFDYSGGSTTIRDNSGVQVFNSESTSGEVRLGAAWGKPGVYSSGALYLFSDTTGVYIGDSNSEKMFIKADGNVGIGTLNPYSKLTIKQPNVGYEHTDAAILLENAYDNGKENNPKIIFWNGVIGTSGDHSWIIEGDVAGDTTFGSERMRFIKRQGTTNTEIMTFTDVGDVSINNNLDVGGDITQKGWGVPYCKEYTAVNPTGEDTTTFNIEYCERELIGGNMCTLTLRSSYCAPTCDHHLAHGAFQQNSGGGIWDSSYVNDWGAKDGQGYNGDSTEDWIMEAHTGHCILYDDKVGIEQNGDEVTLWAKQGSCSLWVCVMPD